MKKVVALVAIAAVAVIGCGDDDGTLQEGPDIRAPAGITVTGPFEDADSIGREFTCDGQNVSPDLHWIATDEAREYALVVTDPDAPGGTYVHWLLYGIEPSIVSIDQDTIPAGAVEGTNSAGDVGYTGPCPPDGDDPHHYEFTIYALDDRVSERLDTGASADELLSAIECCVLSRGTLIGTYGR